MKKPKLVICKAHGRYTVTCTNDGSTLNDNESHSEEGFESFTTALRKPKSWSDLVQISEEYDPNWRPIKIVNGFGLSSSEIALIQQTSTNTKKVASQ